MLFSFISVYLFREWSFDWKRILCSVLSRILIWDVYFYVDVSCTVVLWWFKPRCLKVVLIYATCSECVLLGGNEINSLIETESERCPKVDLLSISQSGKIRKWACERQNKLT